MAKGMAAGELHSDHFQNVFSAEDAANLVCAMTFALVGQMEKTCEYNGMEDSYAAASYYLMRGFKEGAFEGSDPARDVDFAECIHPTSGETFYEMYPSIATPNLGWS